MKVTNMSQVVSRRSFYSKARDQSCKIHKSEFPAVQAGICTGFPPSTSVFLLSLSVSFHECSIFIFLLSEGQASGAWEPLTKAMLFLIFRSSEDKNISMPFTDFEEFLDALVQDRFVLKVFVSTVMNIRVP